MLDSYSTYKYTIRNIIFRKNMYIYNSYMIPKLSKIMYSFKLNKLEDLDDVQVYNYLYFFKFFFGRCGVLTKYKSEFKLGLWSYNLCVFMYVYSPRCIYNNIFLLYIEYLSFIDDSFIYAKFLTKTAKIYSIIIKELNFFSEKKTNMGLFNLSAYLHVWLFFSGLDSVSNKMLPKNLKLLQYNVW